MQRGAREREAPQEDDAGSTVGSKVTAIEQPEPGPPVIVDEPKFGVTESNSASFLEKLEADLQRVGQEEKELERIYESLTNEELLSNMDDVYDILRKLKNILTTSLPETCGD